MKPSELRDLARLAELKKQLELTKLQPELRARSQVSREISEIRRKLSVPPAHRDDPVLMMRYTEHLAFLDQRLRERLQVLSRIEARIARQSPALARASARKDVAERLLSDSEAQCRKDKEAARNALSNQLTS